ncbi:DUF3124 domain-containing protein [Nitratidesulfovibrio vulgaris]|jgi:hypothetical protein|uniref:Conserved domain protein n=1 Tax=Nitratidesulfovibrio vulgaris (strain ATCC 29579 / DSM 644 / CCUG 34227 / NCIMB 8303 / VKM B-1760 / Hildenborough) TaxID=882 RepID=Q727R8_NITV2|nr:DUF3124 domain-containing protein [Nitratidesulfovibrio vulgaris]AAS97259.1 conserved domain protein [Nitratidesulfovibrio vulgaris str. Hildenborough]ADP87715.1 hypothetical protein Deval_2573 [Nitratidesulfovibrio vulgaris RCH1]WCB47313.1 DUF3124 domain-containing protein [Nitratidesulfovibrio vulgaris]
MSGLAGRFVCVLCLITLLLAAVPGHAGSPRSIYVPVYSSVVYGNKERTLSLTTMLSVRNTDARLPVTLTEVRYVNEKGQTVRNYLSAPLLLPPLGSARFIVEERDDTGGLGPSFIVTWNAAGPISPLLVQGVMIGTAGTQGISFITEGRPLP